MTQPEFQQHMGRLIEQFGKGAYSQARVELIWREVKDLGVSWWVRTVDRFLGECRQAPLLPEVREALSQEREKTWSKQREVNKREAQTAMRNLFDPEMIQSICKTITERVEGKVPDEVFGSFQQGIKKLAGMSCTHCEDTGLVFLKDAGGYEWVYRCFCVEGMRQPKSFEQYKIQAVRGTA